MAVIATPAFVQTPKVGVVQCLPADTTALKTVVTGGANGSKIVALTATSDDTAARIFKVSIVRAATTYILGTVTVAITSGTDGTTASTNILSLTAIPGLPTDNDGQPYIFLANASDTLVINCTTTVTAAKTISFVAIYGDF